MEIWQKKATTAALFKETSTAGRIGEAVESLDGRGRMVGVLNCMRGRYIRACT